MSHDFTVLWTEDLPTPGALGLGGALLPWPAADRPWPRTAAERRKLRYPDTRNARDWDLVHSALALDPKRKLPARVTKALGARNVVRVITVQNDHDLACHLAQAGVGFCFDEEGTLLFPGKGAAADAASGRAAAAAAIWASANPRPGAPCEDVVEAAAGGDATALRILHAWAPDSLSRPNRGIRHMKHDRGLLDRVWQHAQRKTAAAEALLRVLIDHAYYPAARRPAFKELAIATHVDAEHFLAEAERDAADRQKWFGVREPLD